MKKFIPILIVLIVCSLCCTLPICAQGDTQLEPLEIELMRGLDIIDDETDSSTEITKGEVAVIIAKLVNREMGEKGSSFAVDYVNVAEVYFNESATDFNSASPVSMDQAIRAFVKMAGYDSYARVRGIKNAAHSLGITKNCNITDVNALKKDEALKLFCNTLMLESFNVSGINDEGRTVYEKDSEKTVLAQYADIYEGKGLVTANQYTNLYKENKLYRSGDMEIDNVSYKDADERYMKYIGRNVKFFYKEGSEKQLIAMVDDENKNKVVTVRFDDVEKIDTTGCTYLEDGKKDKKIVFQRGFDYILNNRVEENRTNEDLQIKDGTFTFVDNNGDGKYDTVIAEKCETMTLTGRDYFNDVYFADDRVIETDLFQDSYYQYIYLLNEDGETVKADFDELQAQSIISVYQSSDKRYLRIYASNAQISGKVDDYDEDYVIIGDVKYEFADKTLQEDIVIGASYEFRIDAFGRIAGYVNENASRFKYSYGYLFRMEADSGLKTSYSARILTSEGGKVYKFKNRINLDGESISLSQIERSALFVNGRAEAQLIRFLESDGEISAIDTIYSNRGGERDKLEKYNEKTSMKYYPGYGIFDGKGRTNSDTFIIAIPEYDEEKTDWENYDLFYSFHSDPQMYTVELFDVNDNLEIGAVLVYPTGSVKKQRSTNGDSAIGVIKKVYYSSADGEDKTMIRMQTNSGEVEYSVNTEYFPDGVPYGFGDVVRYVIDRNKEVVTLFLELGVNGKSLEQIAVEEAENGYYQFFYGKAYEKFTDYMIMITSENNPGFADDSKEFQRVIPFNRKQVIVVDTKNEEITIGSSSNVSATKNNGSFVYVRSYRYNTANHVVIYQ